MIETINKTSQYNIGFKLLMVFSGNELLEKFFASRLESQSILD